MPGMRLGVGLGLGRYGVRSAPPAAPTLSGSLANYGTTTVAYSSGLSVNGGTAPYTWTVHAGTLPAGLSLNASSGVITGTPTSAGTSSGIVLRCTDSAAQFVDSSAQSITVALFPSLSGTLPDPTNGVAYNQSLTLTGGHSPVTYSISVGTLPAGLSINSSTGAVTGTPTGYGASSFTIQVTDAVGNVNTSAQTPTVYGAEQWPGFGSLGFSNQRTTSAWTANAAATLNNYYVPTAGSTLFDYQCTTAGTNGATEPTWPTVAGNTVTSGTAVYTAVTKMIKQDATGVDFTAANNLAAAQATGIATMEDNVTYRVVFTVSNFTGGKAKIIIYGNTTLHSGGTTERTANGTYTEDLTTTGGGSLSKQIRIQSTGTNGTNTFRVTGVSVRRVA